MKWLRYFACLLPGLFGCSPKQSTEWTPPNMTNFLTMTFRVDDIEYQYIEVQDIAPKKNTIRLTILIVPQANSHEKEYVLTSIDECGGVLFGCVVDQMVMIEADWSSVWFVSDWHRKNGNLFVKKSFHEIGITEEMKRPTDRIPILETMIRENAKPPNHETEE